MEAEYKRIVQKGRKRSQDEAETNIAKRKSTPVNWTMDDWLSFAAALTIDSDLAGGGIMKSHPKRDKERTF